MDTPIKPILSIGEISKSESDLVSLGATFNSDKSISTLDGVKYYYSNIGKYINLGEDEILVSDEIEKETVSHPTLISIEDKYLVPGIILYRSGANILPIITSENSSLEDIILCKNESISKDILEKTLEYFGFDDLINSFVINKSMISTFTDGDKYRMSVGEDPEIVKLKVCGLDWIPEEIRFKLENLRSELDYLYTKYYFLSSSIGESFDEVIEPGNISDYISIKTLVEKEVVDVVQIPKDPEQRKLHRIFQNQTEVKIGKKWNPSDDNEIDPFLYWYPKKSYEIIRPRIIEGDLLEISILYRKLSEKSGKTKSNDHYDKVLNSGIVGGFKESEFYSDETSEVNKILFKDKNGKVGPIRFNGKEILFDTLNEGSEVVRAFVKDSFIVTENFYIQVNNETINLFPKTEDITEYYIKSCKKIKQNK